MKLLEPSDGAVYLEPPFCVPFNVFLFHHRRFLCFLFKLNEIFVCCVLETRFMRGQMWGERARFDHDGDDEGEKESYSLLLRFRRFFFCFLQ